MKENYKNLLSSCSDLDFGAVKLSKREQEFYRKINNEIILLCKSLPESTQTDIVLFCMQYFRIPIGQELDFLRDYYPPAWSIIYWISRSRLCRKGLGQEDLKNAITAHTMTLLLHSLDDHLNDNEIPLTHLTLLLRSQAWMIMNDALNRLADGVDNGPKFVQGFIDDYYTGIRSSNPIESLDSYCKLFRKQMAIGLITPYLMTQKMGADKKFTVAMMAAFGSFGIAWRLLDDINDIEADMMKGVRSSIYYCLPQKIMNNWDRNNAGENSGSARIILNCVLENDVITRLIDRIGSELELAAHISDSYKMTEFANQFRCLLKPLANWQGLKSTEMLNRKSSLP